MARQQIRAAETLELPNVGSWLRLLKKSANRPLGGIWRKKRIGEEPDLVPSFVGVDWRESIFRARVPKILFQQPRPIFDMHLL